MTRSTARLLPVQEPSPIEVLSERLRGAERLPLDVALSLSIEIVDAVAALHTEKKVFGGFNAGEMTVLPSGEVMIFASGRAGEDLSLDMFSAATVLYQVFTGLTPSEARVRYSVSALQPAPAASLVNPLLDESISDLLAKMLDRDPAQRPHSLRLVEHVLEDVCEYLDLVHSRDAVAAWWETSEVAVEDVVDAAPVAAVAPIAPVAVAPSVAVAPVAVVPVAAVPAPVAPVARRVAAPVVAAVVAVAAPAAPRKAKHVPTFRVAREELYAYESDDELDEDDDAPRSAAPGPLRFDAWAFAACAFGVVAFIAAANF
ncbi:MAG: hypothetical protein QM817_24090 [Archangium sp.]